MSRIAFSRVGTRQFRACHLLPLPVAGGGWEAEASGPRDVAERCGGVKLPRDSAVPCRAEPCAGPDVPLVVRLTRLLTSRCAAPPDSLRLRYC
ncbi:hypothetical protein SAMN05421870_11351 [Streptomyces qinglanensis]|uniref:Uncharacterized protein n=1 Tax=Streptomyces qinglanensis TaxID=943816 RepID=A0A1H9VS36_9ACTN|nr:hypothetical protein SAMN05421870_11351 [Streptomyces qinglanensis]